MKNRWLPSVVLLASGAALIVTASALLRDVGALWFWIILPVGILILGAGLYELRRAFTGRGNRAGGSAAEPDDAREMPEYRRKRAVLTGPEREFYRLLKELLSPEHFDIYPETALVSVIEKLTQSGYRNELFRVADFCIADCKTAEPLVLIEINDASHRRADRAERDRKVAEICERAGLPLVTFSLSEARDESFVRKALKRYL